MNRAIVRVALAFAFLVPALHAAAPAGPFDTIRAFLDAYNLGDMKAANTAYAKSGNLSIIDAFPPHLWTGPTAAEDWTKALQKETASAGVTETTVQYEKPSRTEVEGAAAYVIVPMTYHFKVHGKPFTEEGQMIFVLHMEAGAWKIRAWTWTGVAPHPAA